MGGAESEVTDATRNLLIECALFDSKRVRATRRALGMNTDASHRYERGVDPDGMERALRRCVAIIVASAGGTPEPTFADVTRIRRTQRTLQLRSARVRQVLGVDIDAHTAADLLATIGFGVEVTSADTVRVDVPGARLYDVEREIDLVEEVARRYGYDRFPDESRPYRPGTVPDDPLARLEDTLRDRLVARGLLESRTVPFAPERDGDVALALPLSAEESRLRRALLPSLLRRVEHNWARGEDDIRLFEIGTGFAAPDGDGEPVETRRLALALGGRRAPAHWSGGADAFDVWDLKGVLEELAGAIGGPHARVQPVTPGRGGEPGVFGAEQLELVGRRGVVLGRGGRVRREAVDTPARIGTPLWAAELVLQAPVPVAGPEMLGVVVDLVTPVVAYTPIPGHPAVERDLALLERGGASAADIDATIRKAAGELLESVAPFDVFRGAGLPEGSRSIAFRLRFRAPGRTLTDEEVDRSVERVLRALKEEHGIERR
jgi:phenylalanyl-tRNA synthetase beta chain